MVTEDGTHSAPAAGDRAWTQRPREASWTASPGPLLAWSTSAV